MKNISLLPLEKELRARQADLKQKQETLLSAMSVFTHKRSNYYLPYHIGLRFALALCYLPAELPW